eukprot:scaffold6913_cov114-Isochrysis_galbana.AAC.2
MRDGSVADVPRELDCGVAVVADGVQARAPPHQHLRYPQVPAGRRQVQRSQPVLGSRMHRSPARKQRLGGVAVSEPDCVMQRRPPVARHRVHWGSRLQQCPHRRRRPFPRGFVQRCDGGQLIHHKREADGLSRVIHSGVLQLVRHEEQLSRPLGADPQVVFPPGSQVLIADQRGA